jgi:hypothetical protein
MDIGDVVKTCHSLRDAKVWCATLNGMDKYLVEYKTVTWHGENRSLFYVVVNQIHFYLDNRSDL